MSDGRAHGIDVSHNDGLIDWTQVAPAGISFAYAKATQGVTFTDNQFSANWQAMKDAGVLRGAYHFIGFPAGDSQDEMVDNVHSQIDHFLNVIGTPQAGDLPPMLDLEDGDSPAKWKALIASNRATALAVVAEAISYLATQLGNVVPVIYTGSFWTSELGDPTADQMPFSSFPLWLAQYPIDVHPPKPIPSPPGTDSGEASGFDEYDSVLSGHTPRHMPAVWGGADDPNWKIWQFSEYGSISAITSSFLDLDVFNGTVDDLRAFCIRSS